MKLSIITTVYQAEKTLPRLLDSMMAVKSKEVEFFLIDNGSTDGSLAICKEYASKDARFVIHHLDDNIGYIRARNLGLELVNGDYVGFSDSDDYIDFEGYDKAIERIKKENCDFYIGTWKTIYPNTIINNESFVQPGLYLGTKIKTILPNFFGPFNGKGKCAGFMWKEFIRKEIIDINKLTFYEPLKPYEDMLFNVQLVQKINTLLIDDVVLYYYDANDQSITSKLQKSIDFQKKYSLSRLFFNKMNEITPDLQCKEALSLNSLYNYTTFISLSARKLGIMNCYHEINSIFKKKEIKEEIKLAKPSDLIARIAKLFLYIGCYLPLIFIAKLRLSLQK